MITVTAFEAKNRFGKLLARVARGEEIVITRHEQPVARIIPQRPRTLRAVRSAVEELRRLQKRIRARTDGKARLSNSEVRSAIEKGRR